jgi:hypothetical protein
MAQPTKLTTEQYLASLPEDRRALLAEVRELVVRHLPPGYAETATPGMLTWSVPLERYPNTYNRQPLACVSLASQKNYCTLHLNSVYQNRAREERLRAAYAAAERRLDLGKACIRFRRLDELDADAIAEAIALTPDQFIAEHEAARAR